VVRVQFRLTESQIHRLRVQARARGLALTEVIRQYIERGLAEKIPDRAVLYELASRLVGRYPDQRRARRLSADHDRYLAEAFEQPLVRGGRSSKVGLT
jgi:hypothetical protein